MYVCMSYIVACMSISVSKAVHISRGHRFYAKAERLGTFWEILQVSL